MATTIERTSYRGWTHCWRMSNGDIELVVTADIGPRVIWCGVPGGQNVFKNFDAQLGTTGEAEWRIRGGSRSEMLELETLGPLCPVAPGQWIEHTEHWALYRNVALSAWTDDELDRIVAPLVNGSPQ